MKKKTRFYLFSLLIFSLLVVSCTKTQYEEDRELIEEYISEKGLQAVELEETGLFYVIDRQGGNLHPNSTAIVTVNYEGYLLDGTIFGADDTAMLALSQTITGWQLGIPLIGEGGRIKLIVPSQYGYGASAVGDIPKNSVLVFDVDLILFN